jgi:hypothetical protein
MIFSPSSPLHLLEPQSAQERKSWKKPLGLKGRGMLLGLQLTFLRVYLVPHPNKFPSLYP